MGNEFQLTKDDLLLIANSPPPVEYHWMKDCFEYIESMIENGNENKPYGIYLGWYGSYNHHGMLIEKTFQEWYDIITNALGGK